VTTLSALSTDATANAYAINDSGVAVGQSLSSLNVHHAVTWTNGVVSALTDFGYGSRATAINDQGVVVGSAQTSGGLDEAVMWQNGTLSVLGVLTGGSSYLYVAASRALSVNSSDQVVGMSLTSGDVYHGFLWQNGTMTDLGTLSGGTTSEALSINASGQIVGFGTDSSATTQAIQWVNGSAVKLANLSSGGSGEAQAINDNGVIVGYSTNSWGYDHAVVWQNGVVTDLNSLLPASSGWVLTDARGINNQGQIVGQATYNGYSVQFTLTLGDTGSIASTSVSSALSLYKSNAASGPFLISDTAANVQASLDSLESLAKASKLFSITLTDALVPTLAVSYTQYSADADAIGAINGTYNLSVTGVSAYDAAWVLPYDSRISTLTVSDTTTDISYYLYELAPLVTQGKITAITATGGGYLSIDYKDWTTDSPALAVMQGSYSLSVYDATAAQAVSLSGQAHLADVGIDDTVANVLSNSTALSALAQKYIVYTDIDDTAANVASNLDALQTLQTNKALDAIFLTDSGIPTLSITPTQLVNDAKVLNDISGSFNLSIDASAANLTIQGYQTVFGTHGNTVVFSGTASEYTIAELTGGQGVTVTDTGTGRTSVDTLTGINAIKFSDVTVILASTPSSGAPTAGNITELYGAVFGRVPDTAGLAYYEKALALNPGQSLVTFAEDFLQSPEYTGNSAHKYAQNTAGETQFITDMYNNLLHRAPETGAVPYYLNLITQLTQGATSGTTAYTNADLVAHATLLVDFSNSAEFLTNVQITAQHPASAQHWLLLL
jgi:probable HAF family extracellular repeat protein